MKRIISLILVSLLTLSAFFCLAGCGKVNDAEVSILWSGEGVATNPNSLINSMERAMYIKKVDYKHYGAKGDAELQVQQAKAALEAGCQVLVVELVAGLDLLQLKAQEIVAAAKAKNVPLIFFNCNVNEVIVNSYDKCFLVKSNQDTIADIQGKLIADYIKANFVKLDKNKDGALGAICILDLTASVGGSIDKANALLATEDYQVKTASKETINATIEIVNSVNPLDGELIVTNTDELAYTTLKTLQASDYNTDKLTTQFVPIFTVGENVDYKSRVVAMGAENYEANRFLVDLTNVKEEDLKEMIYTTINVIDAGRIAGTATEDRDSIALGVAQIVRNICKGNDSFKDVASDSITIDGNIAKVGYIIYTK